MGEVLLKNAKQVLQNQILLIIFGWICEIKILHPHLLFGKFVQFLCLVQLALLSVDITEVPQSGVDCWTVSGRQGREGRRG